MCDISDPWAIAVEMLRQMKIKDATYVIVRCPSVRSSIAAFTHDDRYDDRFANRSSYRSSLPFTQGDWCANRCANRSSLVATCTSSRICRGQRSISQAQRSISTLCSIGFIIETV